MILKEEMNKVSPGATFKRCDLHIHSYGQKGSEDVTDINMTIHNIIETAIKENLDIICITAYSDESGHRFWINPATCRSEATLAFHYTSLWQV